MEWTEEAIATLRRLWAEGHSTAEIGRRMGISKNAVVGKAHRLNLAPRPSPIRRAPGQPVPPRAPRLAPRPAMPRPMPMLPGIRPGLAARPQQALPSHPVTGQAGGTQPAAAQLMPTQALASQALASQALASQPRAPQPVAPRPAPLRLGTASCCWPIGEPGRPGFRFCTAAALAGKPYCEEHAALAYVRARPDRREDAA